MPSHIRTHATVFLVVVVAVCGLTLSARLSSAPDGLTAIVHAAQPKIAHTPGNNRAYIFAPFDFDPSFHEDYKPAEEALKGEGYNVGGHVFARTSIGDTHPTIQDFLQSSGAGVVVVSSHGLCCSGSGFAIETFANDRSDAKADRARDALLKAAAPAGAKAWKEGDIEVRNVNVNVGTLPHEDLTTMSALFVTAAGIEDHWKGDHSFVYIASCCSTKTEQAFKAAGADVVFGYQKTVCDTASARPDFKGMWTRLDGTHDDGKPRGKPVRRTYDAFQLCCDPAAFPAREDDGPSITQDPSIVLAPSVESRKPDGEIKLPSALPATLILVEVQFNSTMDIPTKRNGSAALSVSGCSAKLVGHPLWVGDHELTSGYDVSTAGTLTITVHAKHALSKGAKIELDGNTKPKPAAESDDAPVRPNGDDYVWTEKCVAPEPTPGTTSQCKPPFARVAVPFSYQVASPACTPTPTPTPTATATPAPACTGQPFTIFDNWNVNAVGSGGTPPTFSTGGKTYCLVSIVDYHWNSGSGALPGMLGIKDAGGAVVVAPKQSVGSNGQDNAPDVNWTATFATSPPIVLNGTYTVYDSSPATWSQNLQSGGLGFSRIWVENYTG
jgi:hypothetical protein